MLFEATLDPDFLVYWYNNLLRILHNGDWVHRYLYGSVLGPIPWWYTRYYFFKLFTWDWKAYENCRVHPCDGNRRIYPISNNSKLTFRKSNGPVCIRHDTSPVLRWCHLLTLLEFCSRGKEAG